MCGQSQLLEAGRGFNDAYYKTRRAGISPLMAAFMALLHVLSLPRLTRPQKTCSCHEPGYHLVYFVRPPRSCRAWAVA